MKDISYKVVKADNTSCSLMDNSKYCLTYIKDHVVKKIPGTVGIMVFEAERDAEKFLYDIFGFHSENEIHRKIIRVKILKRSERIPKQIASIAYIWEFYNYCQRRYGRPIPKGTIFADEVKVLD